jgi:hypothetical protein
MPRKHDKDSANVEIMAGWEFADDDQALDYPAQKTLHSLHDITREDALDATVSCGVIAEAANVGLTHLGVGRHLSRRDP